MLIYTTSTSRTRDARRDHPIPPNGPALSSIKFVGAFAGGMLISATLLPYQGGGWLGATPAAGLAGRVHHHRRRGRISFLIVFFNTKEPRSAAAAQRPPSAGTSATC